MVFSITTESFSQDLATDAPSTESVKNTVYGSLGGFVFWISLNGYYERIIIENEDKFFKTHRIRVGGGFYGTYENYGPYGLVGMTSLTGAKNKHFEVNYGLTMLGDEFDQIFYFGPAGSIGYRYQKPNGIFVFRIGGGFPEAIYLSLGFSF